MVRRRTLASVLVAASLALSGCVDDQGGGASGADSDSVVEDYCSYGAVSQAQLDGCVDHVTEGEVNAYDTNAGRYARGELDECLEDAGLFCEER